MSLGTLAINNNSDQVAGTGTSFTTELKINDFIAVPSGGVTYTMVVKAIASDTALTITRPFSGPNVTGANWAAIPAGTMVGVTAKIADDTAYTMRMYVNEANNWMSLLTVDGDVTVYAPDGSSYTGPSWLKLSRIMGTLDMPALTTIAAQIHADAVQVASDTQTTTANTATATQAAQTATTAAQSASQDAQTATTKAGEASASAITAKNEADRAATANPDNQLKKANNLSDLTDKNTARQQLRVQGIECNDGTGAGEYNGFNSPNGEYQLRLANNGEWRYAKQSDGTTAPLSIYYGGTGATNAAGGRANLELGETNTPSFAQVAASLYNGANSGLFYMRNHDASRTLLSYSSIYNEIQSGVAKTTIRTTNSAADRNAFFQFDENGQFNAPRIKVGANYGFTMEGGEANNLQLYSGANVPLDYWANYTAYAWYNDSSITGVVRGGSDKLKCYRISVYSPGVDSQAYDFYPQGNLKTRAFNAGTQTNIHGWGIEQYDSGNGIPFNSVSTTNNNASFSPVVAGGTSTPNGYNIRFAIGMLSPGAAGWSRTILKLLGDTDKHRGFEFNVDGSLGTWANAPGGMWGVGYDFAKNPTSDRDLKKEIIYTDGKESYDRVMQWLPSMFKYNWSNTQRYGLIAQDLLKIDPQYVKLVPGAPVFEDVIGVDEDGNEYVDRQIETDRHDDTLALDSNVLLTDMACAMVYMGNKMNTLEQELEQLKQAVEALAAK